jgi:protein polybromo-1
VEKLKKESKLVAWKGTHIETTLETHPNFEVDGDVLCLGTADETDRSFSGDLVPRCYFSEGYAGDEPYAAWTDGEGWHHLIWGDDNVMEGTAHVRTPEKGCATACAAALIILEELERRRMRSFEKYLRNRCLVVLGRLVNAPNPSWFRPYLPTYINKRALALWAPEEPKIERKPIVNPPQEERKKKDLRKEFGAHIKISHYEHDKINFAHGPSLDNCANCGVAAENVKMMRFGPDKNRSLCSACGLFYVTMGHIRRPENFADEVNMKFEFKEPSMKQVVESVPTTEQERVQVKIERVDEEAVSVQLSLSAVAHEEEVVQKEIKQEPTSNEPEDEDEVSLALRFYQLRNAVEDYPIDSVKWDELTPWTKLVMLAGTGIITNEQVMNDQLPDSVFIQRAIPLAAHSHLRRMHASGKYDKYSKNVTDTERNRPLLHRWGPDDIDGSTIFGYLDEKVQESLEAHQERRTEAESMEEGEEKRELKSTIATEDLQNLRNWDYQVQKSIATFERAAGKAVRAAELERERRRREKEAEEEQARREAEEKLYSAFPVRKGLCDMDESPGLTEEELKQYEGHDQVPEPVRMICMQRVGVLQTMGRSRGERVHDLQTDTLMSPAEFERIAGAGSQKKWKSSCRVVLPDGTPSVTMSQAIIELGDELGDNVVDRRVAVFWPTEGLFYLGRIASYNCTSGEHTIWYDDDQTEDVMLFMQRMKWLDDEVPPLGTDSEAPVKRAPRPSGAVGAPGADVRLTMGGLDVYVHVKPENTLKNSERRKCFEILQAIRAVESKDRNLCEPFEKLPTRQDLPAYYKVIKSPVDCAAIERTLRRASGGYPNVWFFLVAVELMFTNCKRFNDPSSILYADSEKLRKVFHEAVEERFPGHPVPPSIEIYDGADEPSWDRPPRDGAIDDEEYPFPDTYVQPSITELVKKIASGKAAKRQAEESDDEEDDAEKYRPRKSQRSAPRDRRVPKEPVACAKYILARVKGNSLPLDQLYNMMLEKGMTDFANQRRPLAALGALLRQHPAAVRDARGGEVWELADPSEAVSDSEEEPERTAVATTSKRFMRNDERDLAKDLFHAMRNLADKDGRKLAEPFELLPTRKMFPAYYRAISNPIDLGSIQRCFNSGGYPSLWMFLVALELMLSNCQNFNEPDSQLYEDAEQLRKLIAKTVDKAMPGHPVPERDSVYDADKCVEPEWTPQQPSESVKRPTLKFTMKKPAEAFEPPPPCSNCERCFEGKPNQCFEIALLKAAHEKKQGADLANQRSKLRGSMIEVYWPDDDAWYLGKVIKYSAPRREHTIRYDADESTETLQLWSADCSCRLPK